LYGANNVPDGIDGMEKSLHEASKTEVKISLVRIVVFLSSRNSNQHRRGEIYRTLNYQKGAINLAPYLNLQFSIALFWIKTAA